MRTTILILFLLTSLFVKAQGPVMETVGMPSSNMPVSSYTGWANGSTITFSGNAEVQNQESCTIPISSAGGNVFITNTVGTYLELSFTYTGFDTYFPYIDFAMRNYNAASPNELVVERSVNGAAYQTLSYYPYTGNIFLNGSWNYMTTSNNIGFFGTNTFKYRFTQTSSISQFRLDDINFTFIYLLPINLTSFSSNVGSNNGILLNWTANSSNASNSFILERSNDAVNFSAINTQTAKGSGTFSYSYADVGFVLATKVFYRLQMKDVSGKVSYSNILAVNTGKKKSDLIESLYPSPAASSTTIALNAAGNGAVSIEIFDAMGRKVKTQTYSIAQGLNSISVDVSAMKTGTYVLKASTKEQSQSMRLVVIR